MKNTACELLLAQRVEMKMNGSKVEQVINRVRVAEPVPRDSRTREVHIPRSVLAARAKAGVGASGSNTTDLPDLPKRRTQRDEQEEQGGAGVYSMPLQTQWSLKNPDWVNDCIPEIMNGKNILDFVDPDIEAKLLELEAEEEEREALAASTKNEDMEDPEEAEAKRKVGAWAKAIRKRKGVIKEKARMARKNNHPTMSRAVAARGKTVAEFVDHMSELGVKTNANALGNLSARASARSSQDMQVRVDL